MILTSLILRNKKNDLITSLNCKFNPDIQLLVIKKPETHVSGFLSRRKREQNNLIVN